MFRATQQSTQKLTGCTMIYPPLTWPCPGCGRQVTDREATGRPVHVEHGHTPGCVRLAGDQAADAERRRTELPRQALHSEPAFGTVQRHWLCERTADDCPRCRLWAVHWVTAVPCSKALPRWLAWVSFAIAIVAVTPAEFAAFLAFAVWIVIVSVLTWRRSRASESAEERADEAVPV